MVRDYENRVLIAGYTDLESQGQKPRLALIRLLPNGRLDRSFGKAGVARLSESVDAVVRAIAVQRDNRIVVSGSFDRKFGLARFTATGKPDKSFFGEGLFTEYVYGTFGSAWDVMVDSRNRIVASGGTERGDFAVLRLLTR